MSETHNDDENTLIEVRQAREQAETLRDLLMAEYERLRKEKLPSAPENIDEQQRHRGLEAMRKAIIAADHAMISIDQALRDIERVRDDPTEQNR